MNWKYVPHFFANGKFQVIDENNRVASGYDYEGDIWLFNPLIDYQYENVSKTKYCTLIARRIEDMTDEECNNYRNKRIANVMGGSTESPNSFLYLLSIGVLPEQFEHQFKTGEVIDVRSI